MSQLQSALAYLNKEPMLHADMLAALERGIVDIVAAGPEGVLLKICGDDGLMLSAKSEAAALAMLQNAPPFADIEIHQAQLVQPLCQRYGLQDVLVCHQAVYLQKELLAQPQGFSIRQLGGEYLDLVCQTYTHANKKYLRRRMADGMYGAFDGEQLAGFIGVHAEGSLGMLEVLPAYRRKGVGYALCVYLTNHFVRLGYTPYAQIHPDNTASLALQQKLGYTVSKEAAIHWLHNPAAD